MNQVHARLEVVIASFMTFQEAVEEGNYDLVIADEAWDIYHHWHEHPELHLDRLLAENEDTAEPIRVRTRDFDELQANPATRSPRRWSAQRSNARPLLSEAFRPLCAQAPVGRVRIVPIPLKNSVLDR